MSFIDELATGTNRNKRTENGAVTNDSTLSSTLDFFSLAGAMRNRVEAAADLFDRAYSENPLVAVRTLFYLRDVRGGQGEREVFRHIFNNLDSDLKNKLAKYVDEYGRWDDVSWSNENIELIKTQLNVDAEALKSGKSVSLLAKWLPSANSSSKESRKAALKIAAGLGLTERNYRKLLSELRAHIGLLEQKMSRREWSDIDYSKIPTQAHRKHVKAFLRNDEERYRKYLESVEKGEAKINSSVAYTYEIYDMINRNWNRNADVDRAANAMWKGLPDYTNGMNALVLADVSSSMSGRPMSVSVSLALYFAERNDGPFKDYFLTFSARPKLQKVTGTTLAQKMHSIERSHWDMNTDLQAAFDAILDAAKSSNATQDELPQVLYVISDMEFDCGYINGTSATNFEAAKAKFKAAGYELPHLVFWNVDARNDQAPATKYDDKVTLISGSSQSTFQHAVGGKTPTELMLEVVNGPRYEQIVL